MKYKVGDKVRVRGDLKVGKRYGNTTFIPTMRKGVIQTVRDVMKTGSCFLDDALYYSEEMLRPAEFKIWCETEEEKQAVLEELEKEGYMWCDKKKPTEYRGIHSPLCLSVDEDGLYGGCNKDDYRWCTNKFTPSEFTGLDFPEKIIITKTTTGAIVTYGDKTATTEGDFEDASRQALAEVLCPFKAGDKVKTKYDDVIGVVDSFEVDVRVRMIEADRSRKWWMAESLEPYTEQAYNARLFCIKGSNCFKNDYFKRGHIYEVKNGKIVGYDGGGNYTDIKHINNVFSAQFMEVLDD